MPRPTWDRLDAPRRERLLQGVEQVDAAVSVLVLLLPHLALAPFEPGLDAGVVLYGTRGTVRSRRVRLLSSTALGALTGTATRQGGGAAMDEAAASRRAADEAAHEAAADESAAGYPPSPWLLRGRLHASLFAVPGDAVPAQPPPGYRVALVGRRALVVVMWACHEPGGVLGYQELLAALVVRRGVRPLLSITHIWVDSAASRDGGRELWAIPKQLAELEVGAVHLAARDATGPVAAATVLGRGPDRARNRTSVRTASKTSEQTSERTSERTSDRTSNRAAGRASEGAAHRTSDGAAHRTSEGAAHRTSDGAAHRTSHRWRVAFRLVQERDGQAVVTRARVRAGLVPARVRLDADPSGPLAFLAGRRPVLSVTVPEFVLRFGA